MVGQSRRDSLTRSDDRERCRVRSHKHSKGAPAPRDLHPARRTGSRSPVAAQAPRQNDPHKRRLVSLVAAVGLFTVGAAQAAPPVPPNQHLETLDAAQAPANARGQSSSRAAVVTMGRFTSVQANVDSLGNNIVGDAAN